MIHSIYIYKSEFMDIIIYGSLHGSTKRYAERLEEMTGIAAINYKDVKEIAKYDRIIYLGALYASGVMGLKKIVGRMSQNQKLIVATVGLADPENSGQYHQHQECFLRNRFLRIFMMKRRYSICGEESITAVLD